MTTGRSVGGQPTIPSIPTFSRRLIIGIAAVLVAIVIAGLAVFARGGSSSSAVSETNRVQAPAVANTGQQTGQTQTSGGNFTRPANSVRIGDALLSGISVRTLDVRPAKSHLKYVAIEVTVQNVGTSPQRIGDFTLKDSDGVFAALANSGDELAQLGNLKGEIEKLWGATLAPGETIRGVVVFALLRDAKSVELQYVSRARESGIIKLQ